MKIFRFVCGFTLAVLLFAQSGTLRYQTFQQAGTGAVTRDGATKIAETFDVKDFGAKGDGVTDDGAAIAAAITAACAISPAPVRVYFPAATYVDNATPLTMCTGLTLEGDGMQSTVLQTTYNGAITSPFIMAHDVDSVQLLKLQINQTGTAQGYGIVCWSCRYSRFVDLVINQFGTQFGMYSDNVHSNIYNTLDNITGNGLAANGIGWEIAPCRDPTNNGVAYSTESGCNFKVVNDNIFRLLIEGSATNGTTIFWVRNLNPSQFSTLANENTLENSDFQGGSVPAAGITSGYGLYFDAGIERDWHIKNNTLESSGTYGYYEAANNFGNVIVGNVFDSNGYGACSGNPPTPVTCFNSPTANYTNLSYAQDFALGNNISTFGTETGLTSQQSMIDPFGAARFCSIGLGGAAAASEFSTTYPLCSASNGGINMLDGAVISAAGTTNLQVGSTGITLYGGGAAIADSEALSGLGFRLLGAAFLWNAYTGNHTMTYREVTAGFNATSGAITASLPAASGINGKYYCLYKDDATANAVTVTPNGMDTIGPGLTSVALTGLFSSVCVESDGFGWIIISEYGTGGAATGVTSLNSLTGALAIGAGTGMNVSASGSTVTVSNTGVTAVNSQTGALSILANTLACSSGQHLQSIVISSSGGNITLTGTCN